jgi:hypothetical protein
MHHQGCKKLDPNLKSQQSRLIKHHYWLATIAEEKARVTALFQINPNGRRDLRFLEWSMFCGVSCF